jgi:indole-3-glycerol phosphate synthase
LNILDEILEVKKTEVKELRNKYSLNSFSNMEFYNKKSLSFYYKTKLNGNISIIAEIKKASPSKGIIRKDFNHLKIAEIYFQESVDAVSILTDQKFFQGNISFLNDTAKIKQVPLLRKDFIIDEYQVLESKAKGADLILLICEALSKSQLRDLTQSALEAGLEVLLELHSEEQLNKIDFELNKIIGVNNRNLEDFSVNLSTTEKIARHLPEDVILVSESGISKKEDIDFIYSARANTVLVGEHLMKAEDIKSKLKELKQWCSNES